MDLYNWNILKRQSLDTPDDYTWGLPNRNLYLYEPARDMAYLLIEQCATLRGNNLVEKIYYGRVTPSNGLVPYAISDLMSPNEAVFYIGARDTETGDTRYDIEQFELGRAVGDLNASPEMRETICAALDDLLAVLAEDIDGGMFSDVVL